MSYSSINPSFLEMNIVILVTDVSLVNSKVYKIVFLEESMFELQNLFLLKVFRRSHITRKIHKKNLLLMPESYKIKANINN